MKVTTFAIQKGGTGKTSLSVSTAVELAKIGRTIIIDADPQGNATTWLGIDNLEKELTALLDDSDEFYNRAQKIPETAVQKRYKTSVIYRVVNSLNFNRFFT